MFKEATTYEHVTDLGKYPASVIGYISKYTDVTMSKNITVCANQKPWMSTEVSVLLKNPDTAFESRDMATCPGLSG